MNKYVCFYHEHEATVEATDSYNAQIAAFNVFQERFPRRRIKAYQITPALIERDGEIIEVIDNFI